MSTGNAHSTPDQSQNSIRTSTQQGETFVPGRESSQSRAERVATAIQGVEHQLSGLATAQQGQGTAMTNGSGADTAQGQSARHSGTTGDLDGIGQQFHD